MEWERRLRRPDIRPLLSPKFSEKSQNMPRSAFLVFGQKNKLLQLESDLDTIYDEYCQFINKMQRVHTKCIKSRDWEKMKNTEAPIKPEKLSSHEESIQKKIEKFKPGFIGKKSGLSKLRSKMLLFKLEKERQLNEKIYKEKLQGFELKYRKWQKEQELAHRLFAGDKMAYTKMIRSHFKKGLIDFDKHYLVGKTDFIVHAGQTTAIEVNWEMQEVYSIVPSSKIIKTGIQRPERKYKSTPLSKSELNALVQLYVCSCVLRIARDIFAILPIETVLVNCIEDRINVQTGRREKVTIVSVAINRKKILGLNFYNLVPPETIKIFPYRMKFDYKKGFSPIEKMSFLDADSR